MLKAAFPQAKVDWRDVKERQAAVGDTVEETQNVPTDGERQSKGQRKRKLTNRE